jgi:hypothetical protein
MRLLFLSLLETGEVKQSKTYFTRKATMDLPSKNALIVGVSLTRCHFGRKSFADLQFGSFGPPGEWML